MSKFYVCSKKKKFDVNPAIAEVEPPACVKCRAKCVITPPDMPVNEGEDDD